jgi:glycosyltransferase involved in cell wall biosynthesis
MSVQPDKPRVALLLRNLSAGGVGRVFVNLATALDRLGHPVDLIVCRKKGEYLAEVPEGVRIVDLSVRSGLQALPTLLKNPSVGWSIRRDYLEGGWPSSSYGALPGLLDYLRRERPALLISRPLHPNVVAVCARRIADVPTRFVLTVHNCVSMNDSPENHAVARRRYPEADDVVCVSAGVADDFAQTVGLPRDRLTVVHNPVVTPRLERLVKEQPDHPWFGDGGGPVLVAAGRLAGQKDYPTMLRALAEVRQDRPARLILLGEGGRREELERLAEELGLKDAVDFHGHTANPFAFMAQADLYVMSSIYEGLPTVLIEALASGCPVVSTNCPHGPDEILAGGEFGRLVPVGDHAALAKAICATLDEPRQTERNRERGRSFTDVRSAAGYLAILDRPPLLGANASSPGPEASG